MSRAGGGGVSRAGGTAVTVAAGVLAAAAVAHCLPAVACLPAVVAAGPVRRRWRPALAGVGDPGHVALTFDDGPHPEATPDLLRLLDSVGVRATFFVVGRDLEENPEIGRAMVAAGHEIGVHGYEHRLLLRRTPGQTRADLGRAAAAVTAVTGVAPRWWRPPYGVASATAMRTARHLGLTPVLWTTWGRDWSPSATPDRIFRTVRTRLTGGGTILLHDNDRYGTPRSWEATLGAVPGILALCQARGWDVGPLGEHGMSGHGTARRGDPGRVTPPGGGAGLS